LADEISMKLCKRQHELEANNKHNEFFKINNKYIRYMNVFSNNNRIAFRNFRF